MIDDVPAGASMTLAYPRAVVMHDLARAGAGLAVTLGPILALPLAWPAAVALGAAALVFLVFAFQGMRRARLRIDLDARGGTVRPAGWRFELDDLCGVSLAWYTLRRGDDRGWFELVARLPGGTLRVDSRCARFEVLVRAVAAAAGARALELDPATRQNLDAVLGGRTGSAAFD